MSKAQVLSKTEAEKFMEDSSSVDLSTFTKITVEAAQILAGYGKREGDRPDGQLDLSGLTEISEECAEALQNHNGEINLYGINEISPKIARQLAKKSGTLLLNGLTTLSLECAEELAKHRDGSLGLDGLESIDEDVAEALAKHDGGGLCLSGLSEISQEIAEKLIATNDVLRLDGLTTMSDPVARVLANKSDLWMLGISLDKISNLAAYLFHISDNKYEVSGCEEDGKVPLKSFVLTKDIAEEMVANGFPSKEVLAEFSSLSEEAADIFGKSDEDIELVGLNTISETSAEKLSYHKGLLSLKLNEPCDKAIKTLFEKSNPDQSLELGLKELSNENNESLQKFKGKTLDLCLAKLSESTALILSKLSGSLGINQFKKTELLYSPLLGCNEIVNYEDDFSLEICDKCAEILSFFKGQFLSIKGACLTDTGKINLAQNLTSHFYLKTEDVSEPVAIAFSAFKGPALEIDVKNLTAPCAAALAKYQGKLSLINLKELSDEAAVYLSKYSGSELKINEAKYFKDFKISDSALISLSQVKNFLVLPWLPKASDQVVAAFIKRTQSDSHGRTIHDIVKRAEKISSSNLEEIVKRHKRIDLEIGEISEEAAEILSKNQGKLVLSGGFCSLKLSDRSAFLLSAHKGELYLKKDIELSPQGMEMLKKHAGHLHFKEYADFLHGKI